MKLVINSEPSVVSNLINDLLMRRGQILERKDISAGNTWACSSQKSTKDKLF